MYKKATYTQQGATGLPRSLGLHFVHPSTVTERQCSVMTCQEMESSLVAALMLGAFVLLLVSLMVRNLTPAGNAKAKVPSGSFGWPVVGETLSFANTDPSKFVAPRVKKYGPVFKSHLMGVRSIVVTTPDMARFIYSEKSLFRASYPSNIATLVGKKSLSNCDPARHPFLKRIVHSALLPEILRQEVGRLEGYVLETLAAWDKREVLTSAELKKSFLGVALYFIFGIENVRGSAEGQILVKAYQALSKAFYTLPINLPGFTWYKSLKSKKRACDYLSTLIAKSRKDSEEGKPCNSVLRALVVSVDDEGNKLDDDEIIDVLIGTLFGAHDTTATTLTWIIKSLTDHPEILKTVVAEQEGIARLKEPGKPLTWEDTRNMNYTQQLILETLRNPTILQFTARSAMQDVVYKGYLIPKGWRVFVMTTSIHLDPANYPSPTNFDPTRFKAAPKPGTFLPFAGGAHICPGNQLAMLSIYVFVHHLTTKFRLGSPDALVNHHALDSFLWESLQPDMGTQFKPFPLPKGGFPIKVHRQVKT